MKQGKNSEKIQKTIGIAIVGAGLIGKKRAMALPNNCKLIAVCDVDEKKGKDLAKNNNCLFYKDWKNLLNDKNIDAVIVSTSNNILYKVAIAAIKKNKHVLVEKPGAKSESELASLIKISKNKKVVIMFGYNHRYHPAIIKAKEIVDSKMYGPVLFIRAKYGHGGRLNYNKEWRFDKKISGGGQLLDQGSHLIDLSQYFAGPMKLHSAYTDSLFWNTKLEDSAFLILKNRNSVAQLSTTCVEWKNVFQFEIMLKNAKIQIDGLGRSYGNETLTLYKMKPEMGPPDVEIIDCSGDDKSWEIENQEFIKRINEKDYSLRPLKEAHSVLAIINTIYKNK